MTHTYTNKNKQTLPSEESIISYLCENTNFLIENRSLLKEIMIPHLLGSNMSSLIERQVAILREENSKLKDNLEKYKNISNQKSILRKNIFNFFIESSSVENFVEYTRLVHSFFDRYFDVSYIRVYMFDNKTVNKKNMRSDIEKILSEINQSMSTYIEKSELSKINYSKSLDWHTLSDDLFTVIEHANNISKKTNGAFDITIGPLVNLWGFGPNKSENKIPSTESIELVKKDIGYRKILLNKSQKKISKLVPDLYLDLSGIAKGFAVDKIARHLEKKNLENYLIEIGGELLANGINNDKMIWQIGIENPDGRDKQVKRIIQLKNMAMATSGDYKNYFEENGVRYSHTIDPVTGKPIKHKLVSVTVLDNTALNADALATAFMVMGPEKTLSLASDLKVAVYLIIKNGQIFEERYNDYFAPFILN